MSSMSCAFNWAVQLSPTAYPPATKEINISWLLAWAATVSDVPPRPAADDEVGGGDQFSLPQRFAGKAVGFAGTAGKTDIKQVVLQAVELFGHVLRVNRQRLPKWHCAPDRPG